MRYSIRKLLKGLLLAAFNACRLMVAKAGNTTATPVTTNIHQPILLLQAKLAVLGKRAITNRVSTPTGINDFFINN